MILSTGYTQCKHCYIILSSSVVKLLLFTAYMLWYVSLCNNTSIVLLTTLVPSATPGDFTCEAISDTEIVTSWKEVPLSQRNGQVQYTLNLTSSDETVERVFSEAPSTPTVIGGLEANTMYHCSVSAFTSAGSGPSSSEQTSTYVSGQLIMYDICIYCIYCTYTIYTVCECTACVTTPLCCPPWYLCLYMLSVHVCIRNCYWIYFCGPVLVQYACTAANEHCINLSLTVCLYFLCINSRSHVHL